MIRRSAGARLRGLACCAALLLAAGAVGTASAADRERTAPEDAEPVGAQAGVEPAVDHAAPVDAVDALDDEPVLLTNDGLLPLDAGTMVATLGAAAVPTGVIRPPGSLPTDDTGAEGFRAQYFATPDLSGPAALDRVEASVAHSGDTIPAGTETGTGTAAELTPLAPLASARWAGVLTAPVPGTYQLELTSSGTSRLLVDGAVVAATEPVPAAEHPGGAPAPVLAPLDLVAGATHEVVVEYVADESPGTERHVVLGWHPPTGVVAQQTPAAVDVAAAADVAVVLARAPEPADDSEAAIVPVDQLDLIHRVAATNPRTVVVLLGTADVQTAPWEDDVAALLRLSDPAQVASLQGLLTGQLDPAGRLSTATPVDEPRHPLGHGLSYTTFAFDTLRTTGPTADAAGATVTVDVSNTGERPGVATVQVYAGPPVGGSQDAAATTFTAGQLAGWSRVRLEPDETQTVPVELDAEALLRAAEALPAPASSDATAAPSVELHVGTSSTDIRLDGTVVLARASVDKPAPAPGTAPTQDATEQTTAPDEADAQAAPPGGPQHEGEPSSSIPLRVEVPDVGPLALSVQGGALVLVDDVPGDDVLRLRGELPTVQVLDDRTDSAAHRGWTVSGQFTALSGADHRTLPAEGIGWQPRLLTSGAGLAAGPPVPTHLSGGTGLADPAVLASADARYRAASTELGASVLLEPPADAAPGTYRGTVTLTLFPRE